MEHETAAQREKRNFTHIYAEPRELYSATGVGYLLDLSGRAVKDWAKNGKFPKPFLTIGNFVRWKRRQVTDWIEEQGKEATRS